ncbi:Lrp/AsnC family transcriptional regulator [Rathayibacter sp. YIM 133350]|uniref:Lrp/AsnC family transcriptional regulator n=1 Tax=Rathayibacter sp. YIM 133350 TaxID=3131992 RepID=UPI00307D4B2E
MDATDVQMIRALIDAPRASNVALAERLGLSRNTVQARMSSLEASVLASVERRIEPVSLGYPLTAFIAVHVRQKSLSDIVSAIAAIPEVIQAHGLSGQVDVLVQVAARDADHLFRIDAGILAIEGVERTETSLAMGELIPFRMRPLLEQGAP